MGHTTKLCIFGAEPSERFLYCQSVRFQKRSCHLEMPRDFYGTPGTPVVRPHLPCFWRRFVIPLQRADAEALLGIKRHGGAEKWLSGLAARPYATCLS